MKKIGILILVLFICLAFSSDLQKKIVRQGAFDIECYIALKEINTFNTNKIYYWYKSGEIHQSQSNIGGNVLHNTFIKYYRSNQLAEKGDFNYGLKTDVWKSWHENGQLKLQEYWNNGYKDGDVTKYDVDGNLILKGKYKNNLKVGQWINYKTKDTTYYKNNSKLEEKPTNFLQRFLRKKDSLEKVQIKFERANNRKNDSIKRAKLKLDRLIKKRNDSISKKKEKLKRINQKRLDSINRSKNTDKGFFNKLFKKKK